MDTIARGGLLSALAVCLERSQTWNKRDHARRALQESSMMKTRLLHAKIAKLAALPCKAQQVAQNVPLVGMAPMTFLQRGRINAQDCVTLENTVLEAQRHRIVMVIVPLEHLVLGGLLLLLALRACLVLLIL